jgi:hypothetical protein
MTTIHLSWASWSLARIVHWLAAVLVSLLLLGGAAIEAARHGAHTEHGPGGAVVCGPVGPPSEA